MGNSQYRHVAVTRKRREYAAKVQETSGVEGAAEFASPHPIVSKLGADRALVLGADQAFRIRKFSDSLNPCYADRHVGAR